MALTLYTDGAADHEGALDVRYVTTGNFLLHGRQVHLDSSYCLLQSNWWSQFGLVTISHLPTGKLLRQVPDLTNPAAFGAP